MIEYVKGFLGIPSLTYWQGSVLPRCTVPASLSALVVVAIRWIGWLSGDLDPEHDTADFSQYGAVCENLRREYLGRPITSRLGVS